MGDSGAIRTSVSIPWGSLDVVCLRDGTVIASRFSGGATWRNVKGGAPSENHFAAVHREARAVRRIPTIADAVAAWVDGDRDAIVGVPVESTGGPFRRRAWAAMREVRGGTTASYADLAERAGSPRAVRAAGTACAVNPVAPFVPCHRIVRSDGALGNYGYGAGLKAALLRHEGVDLDSRAEVVRLGRVAAR